MRRAGLLLLASGIGVAACSLFLDSGEFSSEDDKGGEGGTDGGGNATDGPVSNETSTNVDAGDADADAGDDFCTRSFANAKHYVTFDLPPQAQWSRITCAPPASYEIASGDGKPAPSLRVSTDGGLSTGDFYVCGIQKDGELGRTYRLGFDVKIASQTLIGRLDLARLHLGMPDGGSYGMNFYHGISETQVEHRFEWADGGVTIGRDEEVGQASVDWVSIRVEIVLEPGGKSRYTLCRDGKKAYTKDIAYPFAVPDEALFDIGIIYVNDDKALPVDIRYDNVFLEVLP